jgi:hypothetical protein
MTRLIRTILSSLLLVMIVLGSQLYGQELSTILGTATDPAGAVVPNVKVTITNEATGTITRATETNSAGIYTAPDIEVGHYRLTAEISGFKTFQLTGIVVNVHSTVQANITLNVGTATESITVQADQVQIQTQSNEVSSVITSKQIEEISTNGRSPFKLQELVPGSSSTLPSFTTPVNELNGGGCTACVSFSGERPYHNLYLVDGGEINDRGTGGSYDIEPSQDAIAEFKVITSNAEPEVGMASGGIISMSVKSGTSAFHGALWEFVRNSAFDANDYFSKRNGRPRPDLHYNLFGGNIGGPLYIPGKYNSSRRRTFFFYNIEDRRLLIGQTATNNTIPLAALPSGGAIFDNPNYNYNNGVLKPIHVPQTQDPNAIAKFASFGLKPGDNFPGNQVPAGLIDPNYTLLLTTGAIPKPNLGNGFQYYSAVPLPTTVLSQIVRVDHSFSDKISLMGSFLTDHGGFTSAPGWSASSFQTVGSTFKTPSYAAQVRLVETINKSLLNEVAFNYDRNSIDIVPYGPYQAPTGFNPGVFFSGANVDNRAPNVSVGGAYGVNTGVSELPWTNVYNSWEGKDSLHWIHGKHEMSFGGSYWLYHKLQNPFLNTQGAYNFSGTFTGDAFADALLGFASSYTQAENFPTVLLSAHTWSFFASDGWSATPRLKVDIGLRWEYLPHVFDIHNGISNFEPEKYNPALKPIFNADGSLDVNGPGFSIPSGIPHALPVPFYLNGIVIPGQNGTPRGIVQNYKDGFAPRVGFSYALDSSSKTVVRGGFGMFYERVEDGLSGIGNQQPFANNPTANNVYFSQPGTSNQSGLAAAQPTFPQGLSIWDTYYPLPTSIQYSLGLQRQLTSTSLFTMAYVGNHDYHQSAIPDINTVPLNDPNRLAICGGNCGYTGAHYNQNLDRNYPGFGSMTRFENKADSHYNGLQTNLIIHTRNGLDLSAAYTWSHATDNGQGDNAGNVSNPYDINYDRGNSAYDRRHILRTSYYYPFPFFSKNSSLLAKTVAGGWQLSGVFTAQTAEPFTVGLSYDNTGLGGAESSRPNLVAPITYPKTVNQWFSTASFAAPPPLVFGSAGRNQLYGPGTVNFDTALFKTFPLWREGMKFDFRLETYNTFNHTNLSNPSHTSFGGGGFGQITGDQGARILQLGGHLSF